LFDHAVVDVLFLVEVLVPLGAWRESNDETRLSNHGRLLKGTKADWLINEVNRKNSFVATERVF